MLIIKAEELARKSGLEVPLVCYVDSHQRVIFGASWCTFIVQLKDKDDELADDLAEAGVLKAILVEEVT